jgi:hypothetical protein
VPTWGFAEAANEDIDTLLAPYLAVVSEINADYGVNLTIPENSKLSVYNKIKSYTPEQYGQKLVRQLNQKDTGSNIAAEQGIVTPYYVVDTIRQSKYFGCGFTGKMDSHIRCVSGDTGTFIYESIDGFGYSINTGYDGFFYVYHSGPSYSVSGDRKSCRVTFTCTKRNADGWEDLTMYYPTQTFYANN